MKVIRVYLDCLVLEVTNACNMSCMHCLRGKRGKDFMSPKVIDAALGGIEGCNTIVFSGGEPSLSPSAIRHAVNHIINNNKTVYSFFVATNGKKYSQSMVTSLIELNAYICKNNGYDEGISELTISKDMFHEKIDTINEYRYRSLSFFGESKTTDFNSARIINEGLALSNSIGTHDLRKESICFEANMPNTNDILIENNIYVNVFGDVIVGCDYSYESQQKYKIGNVLEQPLAEILYKTIQAEGCYLPGDKRLEETA